MVTSYNLLFGYLIYEHLLIYTWISFDDVWWSHHMLANQSIESTILSRAVSNEGVFLWLVQPHVKQCIINAKKITEAEVEYLQMFLI